MNLLLRSGRLFYSQAIIAYGVQQLIIRDFRPQIVPPFPDWLHQYSLFAVLTGITLILLGMIAAGVVKLTGFNPGNACLFLGIYFFVLIITCQLPYLFFIFPHRLYHVGVWADLLKELAFCGGSFVTAQSFAQAPSLPAKGHPSQMLAEKLGPVGRLFFCTTMVLFGWSHFLYRDFISQLVPQWLGHPLFWTYFGGGALIGAGMAIALRIWLRPVALLLATMLFLWFFLVHVPGAVAHPTTGGGNSIVSAFDALLFCGTALVLSQAKPQARQGSPRSFWSGTIMEKKGVRLS